MDSYYKAEHLARFGEIAEGNDELAKKFFDYYASVFADGALSASTKELIALAIGIADGCDGCIASHGRAAPIAAGGVMRTNSNFAMNRVDCVRFSSLRCQMS